jgi:hypothetical protein
MDSITQGGRDGITGGKAIKGSRSLLQCYINEKQIEFNNQILISAPSLLSFLKQDLSIEWKSPLKENDYKEL